ncbi:sugar phosphate isomerase/epimerase family protein [Kriegella aquimaris]|uniref:Sugar phosphate isomerase/epimerase n=1 Tax=Kriegella aquimaris TaxID=192904 RepID=A0A1G9QUW4_9FLAO|nr:sugar phosphate isomerase/epimerase family protein [Kriegella aquimaris]SDM14784.1 Sugar phosphate isomerase/epimerase [Kriegella aquimaris]
MKRRNFIRNSSRAGIAFSLLGVYACKQTKKENTEEAVGAQTTMEDASPFFELSLAQWSIHRMIKNDGVDPYTFAEKAKKWGFTGLEYVSQLYNPELSDANYSPEAMANFVEKSNAEAKKHGLKNVLIMIDGQGNLAVDDEKERKEAIEKHHRWVDAAAAMGCHSIRVNLAGTNDPVKWKSNSVASLKELGAYAKGKSINIIVENHGGLSSNGAMLADVMATTNMDNCGTLPDFGNFCIKRKEDSRDCEEQYDFYKGVEELMPYAKGVSAKSHNFDADGDESEIDYVKMLQIVKDAGYTGFVGVEYEGSELGEEAGLLATKELLLKAAKELS